MELVRIWFPKALFYSQDYLLKWPKTLLVVSHARDFLNTVCTDVLHLHHFKLTSYRWTPLPSLTLGMSCW